MSVPVYHYITWEVPGKAYGSFVQYSEDFLDLDYAQKHAKTVAKDDNAMVTGIFAIDPRTGVRYLNHEEKKT